MSKKNEHQQSANQNINQQDVKKPAFTTFIHVFSDGHVEVGGFPADSMEKALQILAAGMIRLAQHFRDKKKDDSRVITLSGGQLQRAKRILN